MSEGSNCIPEQNRNIFTLTQHNKSSFISFYFEVLNNDLRSNDIKETEILQLCITNDCLAHTCIYIYIYLFRN